MQNFIPSPWSVTLPQCEVELTLLVHHPLPACVPLVIVRTCVFDHHPKLAGPSFFTDWEGCWFTNKLNP